jgi:hypothetical protein
MTMPFLSRPHLSGVLLGLCLAAGLVISTALATRAWLHIADSQTINVTGSARLDVASDLAVWVAEFSAEGDTLGDAQRKLKADATKVAEFLARQGITNSQVSGVSIQRLKSVSPRSTLDEDVRKTVGFRLGHGVRVELTNVAKAIELQQQCGSLVDAGVELDDRGIQYLYTRTAEAKIEMLAAATRDARQRAEQIAGQGGRRIARLRSARMGVFQITARNSNETSAEGMNDTTSRDKSIRSVVNASFALE